MSCPKSKSLLTNLLQNKSTQDNVINLSNDISSAKLSLAKWIDDWLSESKIGKLQNDVFEKEALLDSYVFASWLNDKNLVVDFLNLAKKKWWWQRRVSNMLESVLEWNWFTQLRDFTDDFMWVSISQEELSKWLKNYLTNSVYIDSKYKKLFKKFSWWKVPPDFASLWMWANEWISYWVFFNTWSTDKQILQAISNYSPTIKTLTRDIIEQQTTLEWLEDIVKYNLWSFDEELIQSFSDTLSKIKVLNWEKVSEKSAKAMSILESIETELVWSSYKYSWDINFWVRRYKLLWYWNISATQYSELKNWFFDVMLWWKDSFEYLWRTYTLDNIWEMFSILGSKEILDWARLRWISVWWLSNNIPESVNKVQLAEAIRSWDQELFDSLLKDIVDTNNTFVPDVIQWFTERTVDPRDWIVFFDNYEELYKWSSQQAKYRWAEIYEYQHTQNQLQIKPSDKISVLSELDEYLSKNEWVKNVFVPRWSYRNNRELYKVINKYKERWVQIVEARAWQNFSFWRHDWMLTLRAKNDLLFSEIERSTSFFGNKLWKVKIDNSNKIETLAEEKYLNISNLDVVENFDRWEHWKFVQQENKESIWKKLESILTSIWYDKPVDATVWISDDLAREIWFEFSAAENIERKFEVLNLLKNIYWYQSIDSVVWWWEKVLNHYFVANFLKSITDRWYDIPSTQARWFIDQYIKYWTVNEEFIRWFSNTNAEKLSNELVSAEDVITVALNDIKKIPITNISSDNFVSILPKEWLWRAIVNWPTDELNSIRVNIYEARIKWDDIVFDFEKTWQEFGSIVSRMKKEVSDWIDKWLTFEEMDKIRFKRFQIIDEFEYRVMDTQFWNLYDFNSKLWTIYWQKFNIRPVYKKQDLWLRDKTIDDMLFDYDNRIEKIKKRIVDLSWEDSMEKFWSQVMKDWKWNNIIINIDDAIISESKRIPSGSQYEWLRWISRDWLNKIKQEDKIWLYKTIKQINKDDVLTNWLIKNIFENESIFLRNISFFNEYKIVETSFWPVPEALANTNSFELLDWFDRMTESVDLQLKSDIFKAVSEWIWKTKQQWDNILSLEWRTANVDNIVSDVVEKRFNELVSLWSTPASIDILSQMKLNYTLDFSPYWHLRKIDWKLIDEARRIYWVEDITAWWKKLYNDEMSQYIYRADKSKSPSWISENYETLLTDTAENKETIKYWKDQDSKFLRRLKKEQEWIIELSQWLININKRLFNFYARDIANSNERLKLIYDAKNAIDETTWQQVADAFNNLVTKRKLLYSKVFDQNSYAWNLYTWLDKERFVEYQKLVDWYMLMPTTAFNKAIEWADQWAYKIAKYFRDIRSTLGTDWLWKWPTLNSRVNNAIHNMHESFTSITGTDKDVFTKLSSLSAWIQQWQILKHLNAPVFISDTKSANYIWDIWKDTQLWNMVDWYIISEWGLVVNATKDSIEKWRDAFNTVFWTNLNSDDFIVFNTWISWVKKASIFESKYLNILWNIFRSAPWLWIAKTFLNTWANLLSWLSTSLWYSSLINTYWRKHTTQDIDLARALRLSTWFWSDVWDSTTTINALSSNQYIDALSNSRSLWEEDLLHINTVPTNSDLYKKIQTWDNVSMIKDIYKKIWEDLDRRVRWTVSSKTSKVLTMNWQNMTDIIFSWSLKDISMATWIKNNWYRNFYSADEFIYFMKNAPEQEKERVLNAIRSTSTRTYQDIVGINFSSSDQPVNPYTWWKWWAMDFVFLWRDAMSYLNWWARSIARWLFRTIEQTWNILFRNWINQKSLDDAVEFIWKTPEYRAFVSIISKDVVNSIRLIKFNEWTEDDDLTFKDFYRALEIASPYFQAFQSVWEFRPLFAAWEAYMEWWDALLAWYDSLSRTLLSNFKPETFYLWIVKNLNNMTLSEAVQDTISKMWIWNIKFVMWKMAWGWKLFVPWYRQYWITNILNAQNQDQNTELYYKTLSNQRLWEIMYADNPILKALSMMMQQTQFARVLNDVTEYWVKWIDMLTWEDQWDEITIWSQVFSNAKNFEVLNNALVGKKWVNDYITKWYINIDNKNELKTFDKLFFFNNPYNNKLTYETLKWIAQEYVDTWNISWSENYNTIWLKEIFWKIGKEKLSSIISETVSSVNTENWIQEWMKKRKITKTEVDNIYWKKPFLDAIDWVIDWNKDSEYYKIWWQMKEFADDINNAKTESFSSSTEEEALIWVYNRLMPKWSEQNPDVIKDFAMYKISKDYWEQINKETWKAFVNVYDNKWKKSFYAWWFLKEYIDQSRDVYDAAQEWDYDKWVTAMNVITSKLYWKSDWSKIWAAFAIWKLFDDIDQWNYSEKEKILLKTKISTENFDTILSVWSKLKEKWFDITPIISPFLENSFKLESDLSDALWWVNVEKTEEEWKNKTWWKGWWGWWSKFKWVDIKFWKLKEYKSKLSSSLDSYRADYKLNQFNTKWPDIIEWYWEKQFKQKYPMNISAKTKTPAWFTKEQLKPTKDINRNIKVKKSSLPK